MCVAQLDRALGYGPRCRGFESSRARLYKKRTGRLTCPFSCIPKPRPLRVRGSGLVRVTAPSVGSSGKASPGCFSETASPSRARIARPLSRRAKATPGTERIWQNLPQTAQRAVWGREIIKNSASETEKGLWYRASLPPGSREAARGREKLKKSAPDGKRAV